MTTLQHPTQKTIKVQAAIFDGFEVTDALPPFDVLQISQVTLDGASQVNALDNVHIQPTAPFDPSGDLLIIPGAPQLWHHAQLPPT